MKELKEQARIMIKEEAERANQKHKLFQIPHEGWAILKEEIEEAAEELDNICLSHKNMWAAVRGDKDTEIYVKRIKGLAVRLIAEAAQIGAAAERCMQSFGKEYEQMFESEEEKQKSRLELIQQIAEEI